MGNILGLLVFRKEALVRRLLPKFCSRQGGRSSSSLKSYQNLLKQQKNEDRCDVSCTSHIAAIFVRGMKFKIGHYKNK